LSSSFTTTMRQPPARVVSFLRLAEMVPDFSGGATVVMAQ